MDIKEFINENLIKMNLESKDKDSVIKEMIEIMAQNEVIIDKKEVIKKDNGKRRKRNYRSR